MQGREKGVIPWLWGFLRPYRWRVLAALTALAVGSGAWLLLGQGVRLLVDQGFLSGEVAALNRAMILVLWINLVGGVAVFFRFYLMTWLGERVSADIRTQVFEHLLTLSPTFYDTSRTGEVISRFTADTTVLQTVVGMSLSMALRSGLTLIGGILMMAFTSVKLTAWVLLAVPVVLGPIFFFGRRVRRLARTSQDRVADMGADIDETLHEIQTVQAYGLEGQNNDRFGDRVEAVMSAAQRRIRYRSGLIAAVMILSVSAITLVSWAGALDVMAGRISAGELTAFLFYAVLVAGAVATISEVIGEIQKAAGASERLRELMAERTEIPVPAQPVPLPQPLRGALSFDAITFAYPSAPKRPVLSEFNLAIEPGERVALVGPSGAGKSTLFQLLKRFYLPQQGQLRLDGVDAALCDPKVWRQQFAWVAQEPVIFAGTLRDNVRCGRPGASDAEVAAACDAAQVSEFIDQLPQGWDSELGERGVRLSGGQKQRIAIARALLADRPVLLLDEATSALDAANEVKVQQALEQLMAGRTCLIIAHRLATVANADRLVMMERGQIRAIGNHQQLLQQDPLYRELAELQLIAEGTTEQRTANESVK